MRIAVASDDGENITLHFGRCRSFVIFETGRNVFGSQEVIPNPVSAATHEHAHHHRHHAHDHAQILAQLNGCDVVICGGMGRRMVADLERVGIRPVFTRETDVHRAVERFLAGELETLERPPCHRGPDSDPCT